MAPIPFLAEQRTQLLGIARAALVRTLRGDSAQNLPTPMDPALRQHAGAFVTLRTRTGDLRGCIGRTAAAGPVAEVVAQMAVAAGTQDPRFPPVLADELETLVIEVSVLTAPVPCQPAEVLVGRDGLVVQRGRKRGLLLPQVATERGWSREQFLSATCRKAGLPRDAWRDGVELFRFEALHFEEET